MAFLKAQVVFGCITMMTTFIYFPSNSAPIPTKMIDMTYVLNNNTVNYPDLRKFQIVVTQNETVNNTYWLQTEELSSSVHIGTHVDAPCHFSRGSWCVDDIPIAHLVAPAAVIDVTSQAESNPNYLVTVNDLLKWENDTGHNLDKTIVLIRSGWGKRWGNRKSFIGTNSNDITKMEFPGMSPQASQWLVDNRMIYGLGTETLSLDYGPSTTYRSHTILYGANIFGIENVANMAELPIYGATLYVMPMKIGKGSGAPARVMATYPEIVFPKEKSRSKSGPDREVVVFY